MAKLARLESVSKSKQNTINESFISKHRTGRKCRVASALKIKNVTKASVTSRTVHPAVWLANRHRLVGAAIVMSNVGKPL